MKHVLNDTKDILDVGSGRKQQYQVLAKVTTEVKLHLLREKCLYPFGAVSHGA